MKFVALALALFLAVGSQAASLQADAPSQLEYIRSAMDVYAIQLKESAKRALDKLDGTQYANLKDTVNQRIDVFYDQLKATQQSVAPMTDSFVKTIMDATADVRANIRADIDNLNAEIEPKRDALKKILDKHFEEYRTHMEPIMKEYAEKHNADMEAMKLKLTPVIEELRTKVETNLEETKTALQPIVEAVRSKISDRLENLKALAAPYVEEYKDQAKSFYDQAGKINAEQLESLKAKITPLAVDVKEKLQGIFEAIAASFSQN